MTLEVISPTAALLDGRYVLHDRVGQGGMATVYRAEDTHLGRIVAIKMIHEGTGPVASIERAHTEKALLASLSHPSLVTLYDAQLIPGRPQYLVMEFVDGPTLAGRMAEGPLPPRDVARITRDLAEGWPRCTRPGSCTATSSRRTCCWREAARAAPRREARRLRHRLLDREHPAHDAGDRARHTHLYGAGAAA